LKYRSLCWLSAIALLLILPQLINGVSAQTQQTSFITVNPTTPNSPIYTALGKNQTVSFAANWTYGADIGKPVQNATVTIQVKGSQNETVEQLAVKTSDGIIAFNYSAKTANILTFTPIKVVTEDKKEWLPSVLDAENTVYGLQAKPVVVWWDTFHVSLIDSDTNTEGTVKVTVNVTYQLLPENGLSLPAWATYSNQTFLPKTAQNVNVIINGVAAQPTGENGVYSATSSTWLSTAYVHVAVSQEGWTTMQMGFSFGHNANAPMWMYGTAIVSVVAFAALMLHFLMSKKASSPSQFRHPNYPFFGSVLLAVTAVISLYWAIVAFEGASFGFDWLSLAVLGVFSFALGIAGSILTLGKKQQATVIFLVMMPLLINLIGVKAALDTYQLTNPWPILIASLGLSIASGFFICNSDDMFQKKSQPKNSPQVI